MLLRLIIIKKLLVAVLLLTVALRFVALVLFGGAGAAHPTLFCPVIGYCD